MCDRQKGAPGSVSLTPSHDFPPPSHSACATRWEVRTERQSQRERRRVGGSEKPFYNWVTWKCQRWGASFFLCDAHKHLLPHTQTWTHFAADTFFFSAAFRLRRPCRCLFCSWSLVKSLTISSSGSIVVSFQERGKAGKLQLHQRPEHYSAPTCSGEFTAVGDVC